MGPLASSPPPSRGRCLGSRPRALPTTLEAPLRPAAAPQPPPPPPALSPGRTGSESYLAAGVRLRPVPGLGGALRRLPVPGLTEGPHAGRRRPRARKFANFAPPPRTASAGRRNRCPARRRRRPCPGLSQAGRSPSGPGPAWGKGAASLGRRQGPERWALGEEGEGGGEVSGPRPPAAALRPPPPRHPEPYGRAAQSSTGDRCPHRRSAPAPGPARDSLRNPIPPPPARPRRPPRRPSHSICRSALDSASRRSAPARCPPPSQVRVVLPARLRAHGPPPPRRRRRRSQLLFFVAGLSGEGRESGEKLSAEARETRGAIAERDQTAGPRPAVAELPSASVWGPRPRRRPVCC